MGEFVIVPPIRLENLVHHHLESGPDLLAFLKGEVLERFPYYCNEFVLVFDGFASCMDRSALKSPRSRMFMSGDLAGWQINLIFQPLTP